MSSRVSGASTAQRAPATRKPSRARSAGPARRSIANSGTVGPPAPGCHAPRLTNRFRARLRRKNGEEDAMDAHAGDRHRTVLPGRAGRARRRLGRAGRDRAPNGQPRPTERRGRGDRAYRRWAERAGGGAGWGVLRLQQRRLGLAQRGRDAASGAATIGLHGRADRARGPDHRRGPGPVRSMRRGQAARAERHRVRHPGWLLLHRPREGTRARPRPGRALLRHRRWHAYRRGRLSHPHPERGRPLAGRADRVRRRDRDPPGSGHSISRRRAWRASSPSPPRMAAGW